MIFFLVQASSFMLHVYISLLWVVCVFHLEFRLTPILLKYFCRLELLQERERRKEEEVNALKRSMQGGMVSTSLLWEGYEQISFCLRGRSWLSLPPFLRNTGTSNERASPTEGRDGLSVQAWQFWGERGCINLPLVMLSICNCELTAEICPLLYLQAAAAIQRRLDPNIALWEKCL